MIKEQRLVHEFLELVQIDSLTRNERKIADRLQEKLTALGLTVREDNAGEKIGGNAGNVIGLLPGNTKAPAIMLTAHMDTVVPGENIKPLLKDGRIVSDGTTILGADDKAGIAGILEALRVIKEQGIPHGDIEVVFSIAEEGGLHGAKGLDVSSLRSAMAFCFDTGGPIGTIISEAPAHNRFTFVFHGKPSHAGAAPEKGINAIQAAGVALANMKLGRIDEETTANIGVIHGGEATNIIPARVEMIGEARSRNEQKLAAQTEHMIKTAEEAAARFGAKVEIDLVNEYPAYKHDPNAPVLQMAVQAAGAIGLTPRLIPSGGGADANIYNSKGLPTVNLGTGMTNAHTLEESILVADLVKTAEYVVSIIKTVAGAKA